MSKNDYKPYKVLRATSRVWKNAKYSAKVYFACFRIQWWIVESDDHIGITERTFLTTFIIYHLSKLEILTCLKFFQMMKIKKISISDREINDSKVTRGCPSTLQAKSFSKHVSVNANIRLKEKPIYTANIRIACLVVLRLIWAKSR